MLYNGFMQYKTIWINGKQKRLHRHLMEQKIGRQLGYNEIVHHKDGNIHNNDLGNLTIMTRAEHMAIHEEIRTAAIKARQKYDIDMKQVQYLYVDMDFSSKETAKVVGVPYYTINFLVRKHGLKHKKFYCTECGEKARYKNPPLCNKCYQSRYYRSHAV